MKVKKLFKGILPVVIVLSLMLFAVAPVAAQGPEPQVTATGTVSPDSVPNDGASVLHFSWDIYNWSPSATSTHYTFQVNTLAAPTVPIYIQYSDGAGTDTFVPTLTALQNVAGTPGSASNHIRQPDYTGTHDWAVPASLAPGYYSARVIVTLSAGAPAEASIPFEITQATGNLRVEKEDNLGNPLSNWSFNIQGGDVPTNLNGITNASGYYLFSGISIGSYTVTETMKANWLSVTPGEPGPYTLPATVVYNTTETVTFVNEPVPGGLSIHKYQDAAPLGSYEGNPVTEPGLYNWEFKVYGPDNPSNLYATVYTDASGDYTLSSIPSGTYKVVETVENGWRNTDPGTTPAQKTNIVVNAGTTTGVMFGNQELGDLLIFKYIDEDASGTYNAGDTLGEDWSFKVTGVSGTFVTDSTGYVTVPDLIPGTYTVTEWAGPTPPAGFSWECTDPGSGKQKSGIVVPSGGTSDEVQFGNHLIEHVVPTLSQWGIIAMSAAFVGLLVWFGMRRRRLT